MFWILVFRKPLMAIWNATRFLPVLDLILLARWVSNILSYFNLNVKISDFPYVMHYEFSCWNYLIEVFHENLLENWMWFDGNSLFEARDFISVYKHYRLSIWLSNTSSTILENLFISIINSPKNVKISQLSLH
jgi:hypothetical protein